MRIGAVVGIVAAIALFVGLAWMVGNGSHLAAENAIMRSLRHEGVPIGPAGFADVVRDLTALGSATVLSTLTLLIVGYLVLCGRYRIAVLVLVATVGGQALNQQLKNSFDRARPAEELRLVTVSSSSFPSGHAMAGSIFYLTMGALLARTSRRRREKIFVMAAALLLSGLVGFSRVYLGVHYPTDVIAGWMAGAAWALSCWIIADWLGRHGALRRETGEPATA